MKVIIEKANEIRKKYGVEDLELIANKLGAEVIELPLGRVIKDAYFKEMKIIVIDPNRHPYKKRHLIAHGLAHHIFHRKKKVNYFIDQLKDFLKGSIVRKQKRG